MPLNRTFTASWRDAYISTSELTIAGERALVYRAAERGDLVRIVRGVYLPKGKWDELITPEARHLARIRATAIRFPDAIFSHLSAAVLWGMPIVGTPLNLPHVFADRASGGRSMTGLVRHCTGVPDDAVQIDGIRVASMARTVVDVAAAAKMSTAVAVADFALRSLRDSERGVAAMRVQRDELLSLVEAVPLSSGAARCRRSVEFADGRSGSPGESVSRVGIDRLGFPPPELQVPFRDHAGLIGIVDFWWEDYQKIGEFDGFGKYLREELRAGEDAGQVVVREKLREDRLRAPGRGVTRWGWSTAASLPQLGAHLVRAGLRPR
jgi:hypothetical protein